MNDSRGKFRILVRVFFLQKNHDRIASRSIVITHRSIEVSSFHRRKGGCHKRDFRLGGVLLSAKAFFPLFFDSRSSRRIIDPPLQLEFLTVSAEDHLKTRTTTTTAIAVSGYYYRVLSLNEP